MFEIWDTHFCSLSDKLTSTKTPTQIWLGTNPDKYFYPQEWFCDWDFLKFLPSSSSSVTQRHQCLLCKIPSRILPFLEKIWPRQGDNVINCSWWAYVLGHCRGSCTRMGARTRPSTSQGSPIHQQLAHISSETRQNDDKDLSKVWGSSVWWCLNLCPLLSSQSYSSEIKPAWFPNWD